MNKPMAEAIAEIIRHHAHDPDNPAEKCMEDENACFELHPIHVGGETAGKIDLVYADVDGLAKILADTLFPGVHK